ncbi:MAG: flavoprotein [Streptomycetaceae bacterium]|nr:flavoprotein [Streptomycetaceae bacterium]
MTDQQPFLSIVVCAAGVAPRVGRLVDLAHDGGWEVGITATPNALNFLDTGELARLTGNPVRSAWRTPGEPRPTRAADAVVCAPATLNTITKMASAHADTLALGVLTEAPGLGIPTVVLPYLNTAQAAHPAYPRALETLRSMRVLIGSYVPHAPKTGGGADRFDWSEALDLLAKSRTAG